jgi:hypothetical protein
VVAGRQRQPPRRSQRRHAALPQDPAGVSTGVLLPSAHCVAVQLLPSHGEGGWQACLCWVLHWHVPTGWRACPHLPCCAACRLGTLGATAAQGHNNHTASNHCDWGPSGPTRL